MMLIKVALMVVLCFLQVVISIFNYLLDLLHKVNCIRDPTLVTHNDINWQPNLFCIHQFK